MHQHIAFLHTSPVHVETFGQLASAADPALRVEHVVAEELLALAQRVGSDDPALVLRVQDAMRSAAAGGAAIVACTCSTIGGPAERTATDGRFVAVRIDRAMADRAVRLGPRILIVAALDSTLGPSAELIRESAAALQVEVELECLVVPGAWAHFMNGERAAYLQTVVQALRAAPANADVIVLAQASMAPAAQALQDLGVEVLSSPALGVQSLVAHLGKDGHTQ